MSITIKTIKKIMVCILCVAGLFSSCKPRDITNEQSKENFIEYEKVMQEILESYGYQAERETNPLISSNEKSDENSDKNYTCRYIVQISEDSFLKIRFENEGGIERFYITLENSLKSSSDKMKNLHLPMMLELANSFSKNKYTEKICNNFLATLPEENSISSDASEGEKTSVKTLITKSKSLNFWENWRIIYQLKKEDACFIESFWLYGDVRI